MKIVTGINKWRIIDNADKVSAKIFGLQSDAEEEAARMVVKGECEEAIVVAAVSKMILPPVEAIKVDV